MRIRAFTLSMAFVGVNHGPDFLVEGQERDELGPGGLPQLDDGRVLGLSLGGEVGETLKGGRFGRGGVDRLEVFGDGRPVPTARVAERISK